MQARTFEKTKEICGMLISRNSEILFLEIFGDNKYNFKEIINAKKKKKSILNNRLVNTGDKKFLSDSFDYWVI